MWDRESDRALDDNWVSEFENPVIVGGGKAPGVVFGYTEVSTVAYSGDGVTTTFDGTWNTIESNQVITEAIIDTNPPGYWFWRNSLRIRSPGSSVGRSFCDVTIASGLQLKMEDDSLSPRKTFLADEYNITTDYSTDSTMGYLYSTLTPNPEITYAGGKVKEMRLSVDITWNSKVKHDVADITSYSAIGTSIATLVFYG